MSSESFNCPMTRCYLTYRTVARLRAHLAGVHHSTTTIEDSEWSAQDWTDYPWTDATEEEIAAGNAVLNYKHRSKNSIVKEGVTTAEKDEGAEAESVNSASAIRKENEPEKAINASVIRKWSKSKVTTGSKNRSSTIA